MRLRATTAATATRLGALILGALAVVGCADGGEPVQRVVIVTFDTTRADRIGAYGFDGAETPTLDALAGESVLFERAVSPVPTTLPSHSTMFTGLYPQDHGVRYNLVFRLSPGVVTLAERLRDAGFATAGVPSAFVVSRKFGLDQGFDHYPDPPGGPGEEDEGGELEGRNGLRADEVVDRALAWLAGRREDERVFLWAHFYDPHAPYAPPFPYSSTWRERPYDGEIAYADSQLGRLLDALRADPAWERTLLIVAGDHGEGLHEHGERFHANLIYESTQHVPLLLRPPGGRAGRVAEPVTLADLTPTVLDFAGLPVPEGLRGVSLRGTTRGERPPARAIYFESLAGSLNYGWAELTGVREGRWKLIDSESPELFDLDADPQELNNLAGLEPQRVEDLRAVLAELGRPAGSSSAAEPALEPVLDPETEAFLASLGYVAGGAGGSSAGAAHPRDLIDLEAELLEAQGRVQERDWPGLEETSRYVLGRDPHNKWALNTLAAALMWTDRPVEAEEHAAELVRLYPDNEAGYTLLARALKRSGNTARALEVLTRGVERVPASVGLRYLYLVAAFDEERPNVCGAEVPAAVERHSGSGLIVMLRARCEARAGEPAKALETLREAVERGFGDIARLEEADDFAAVAGLEGFRELVEEVEARREKAGQASPEGD